MGPSHWQCPSASWRVYIAAGRWLLKKLKDPKSVCNLVIDEFVTICPFPCVCVYLCIICDDGRLFCCQSVCMLLYTYIQCLLNVPLAHRKTGSLFRLLPYIVYILFILYIRHLYMCLQSSSSPFFENGIHAPDYQLSNRFKRKKRCCIRIKRLSRIKKKTTFTTFSSQLL